MPNESQSDEQEFRHPYDESGLFDRDENGQLIPGLPGRDAVSIEQHMKDSREKTQKKAKKGIDAVGNQTKQNIAALAPETTDRNADVPVDEDGVLQRHPYDDRSLFD